MKNPKKTFENSLPNIIERTDIKITVNSDILNSHLLSTIDYWLQLLTTLTGIAVIIIPLLGFRRAEYIPAGAVRVRRQVYCVGQ